MMWSKAVWILISWLLVSAVNVLAAIPAPGDLHGVTCYLSLDESDVSEAKKLGFNSMRIMVMAGQLHYHVGQMEKDTFAIPADSVLIYEPGLALLKQKVDLIEKYGLTPVVDLHELPACLVRWSGWKDFRMWNDETMTACQKLFVRTWTDIAHEFKDDPNVVFEIFNEPEPKHNDWDAPENWPWKSDTLQLKALRAIRFISQERQVIIGAPYSWRISSLLEWNKAGQWNLPEEIKNDRRLWVAVHMYHPHELTMQFDSATARAYPGEFLDLDFKNWVHWDKKKIRAALAPIAEFQKAYPDIPVVMTEFGISAFSPGAGQWITDNLAIYHELGVGWFYHAWREAKFNGWKLWDMEFGPPDRQRAIESSLKH